MSAVSIRRGRPPFGHFEVRDADAPTVEDGRPVIELVIVANGDPDEPPDALIQIVDVATAPWPYCETWGEPLTPSQARRLAELLTAAADHVEARRL